MRKILIALAAFAALTTVAALPSGAGFAMGYVVTIAPTTGEAGTQVTFTPTDLCPTNWGGAGVSQPGDTLAAISLSPDPVDPSDFLADTVTDSEGDWSLDYTIPASSPAGDITFYAFCLYHLWPATDFAEGVPADYYVLAEYDPVTFTVTVPVTTTSTSTTSTSTTTTTAAPAPIVTVSPTTVFPGDTVAVNAAGFQPGSSVAITLESDPISLGSYVADSAGRIATNITIPADFPAGAHTLKLTGTSIAGSVLVLSTGITVASRVQATTTTVATVAPATTTLPQTGTSFTEPALIAGAALVLVGAGAVLVARRRSTSR